MAVEPNLKVAELMKVEASLPVPGLAGLGDANERRSVS